ncbi:MAG: hypothetical protein J0H69_08645 [Burkholderiales bacterium]|nr:hypothetical protein [Burkholderiales bacterium]
MKPVRIDFVPSRSWIPVWSVAAALGLAICGVTLVALSASRQQARVAQASLATIAQEVARLDSARTPPADPKAPSAHRASMALNADLDKVLLPLERLAQEGVRLVGVQLDQAGGTVRVEYELDAIQRVPSITAELNAGHEGSPWQFEGVQSQPAAGFAGTASARASWRAETGRL